MTDFNKEYWKKRCELAEALLDVIGNGLVSDSIKIKASKEYHDFISSPDAIELYSEKKTLYIEVIERDWQEDFAHENGNCQCFCGGIGGCGLHFRGHKRRVTCKVCANKKL